MSNTKKVTISLTPEQQYRARKDGINFLNTKKHNYERIYRSYRVFARNDKKDLG